MFSVEWSMTIEHNTWEQSLKCACGMMTESPGLHAGHGSPVTDHQRKQPWVLGEKPMGITKRKKNHVYTV